MRIRHNVRRPRRHGVGAATLAVAAGCAIGAVGIASAADDATISADDGVQFMPDAVAVQVDDTVTWTFDNPNNPHNVSATDDSPTPWTFSTDVTTDHPDVSYTFAAEGVYRFRCDVHGGMDGEITVTEEEPTATPTPTPTMTATPTPTPTPTPIPQPGGGGGGGGTTPPPAAGSDTIKPTVGGLRLKALRRAVRVRFTLSEPASVTVRVKRRGSRKVIKSARVQAPAGTRSVTLRSKRLKKGRYTVDIQARDAGGNRSTLATKRLTLRR
jgi:plastocyanin